MKVVNAMLWMWRLRVLEFSAFTPWSYLFLYGNESLFAFVDGVCMSESCTGRLKYEDWTQAATYRGLIALCCVGRMILIPKHIPSRKKK